jgi:hypothetical protein
MENEIWKDIIGYESKYQVSNLGNVKSLNYGRTKKERLLKACLGKSGYLQVDLCKNGIRKSKSIHILVCESFLNHISCKFELVVDHIDSDKLNNHINNLRIITNRENNSKERTLKSGLHVGVCWNKRDKKYQSRIYINKKRYHLGYFNTPEEASNAYQLKLNQLNK